MYEHLTTTRALETPGKHRQTVATLPPVPSYPLFSNKQPTTSYPHHHSSSLAHLQLLQSVTALIDSIQTRVQTPDNDEGTGNPRETQTDSGNIAPVLLTSISQYKQSTNRLNRQPHYAIPRITDQPVIIKTLILYMHIHPTISNSGNTR